MNERIEKLAELCTSSFVNMHGEWEDDFDKEKFAELLLEEMYCFMVDATSNDEPWPSFEQIKKHFGVEE